MKEIHFWNFIHSHLNSNQNNSVILIAVVDHSKGSPGKRGFKMAVSSSGDSAGSIGGGVMEFNIIKKCKEFFEKKIEVNMIEKLYHNKKESVKNSGLICAGSQTNFMITLGKKDLSYVTKIMTAVKGRDPGKIVFDQKGINFIPSKKQIPDFNFEYKNERDWKFEQATGKNNIVYVIGSGHVGLEVCRILSLLDFYIIVYDSRDDLKTFIENKFADKKIIGPYKELGKIIEQNSYIVIVTTGFDSDKEALKQVIDKNVKYIGLMGTLPKIKKIFNEAAAEGVSGELLEKIHAPIGIDINSDSPEEIAVSIAAEIISVKNR